MLSMEGTAYPNRSALVGGRTDPRKQDSHAYRHPQISEEVNPAGLSSSLQPGPTQGIDGGSQTPSSKRLLPPPTPPGPAGRREACKRRYSCGTCGKTYAQPQGVSRHCQRAHKNPHSCYILGCKFKWTRPYEYRAHLKKQHPNVNPDEVLDKPAGSRLRSTIIGRDRLRCSPVVEPDQQSQAELRRPITPAVPALVTVTNDPLPVMSPVALDPQPEYAGPSIETRKHEDGCRLYFLGATDAPSAFSSTEMCIHGRVASIRNGRTRLPSHLGGSTTTADCPSGPTIPLIPALTPPIGYCRPVFGDPAVEPSSISPYLFPVADYSACEIGTNTFAP